MFDTSPVPDGHLSPVSPATSLESSPLASEWDAESFHTAGVSPATSAALSITHRTADLQIRVMSREQTLHPALKLLCDTNLMTSNLNVLQQYALSLHGKASDILQLVFGRNYFPSTAVHDVAPVPRVRRASTHMAAMGLVVQDLLSFIRAPTVPGALHVFLARPALLLPDL